VLRDDLAKAQKYILDGDQDFVELQEALKEKKATV
jgi:hypothetical protein